MWGLGWDQGRQTLSMQRCGQPAGLLAGREAAEGRDSHTASSSGLKRPIPAVTDDLAAAALTVLSRAGGSHSAAAELSE